MNATKKWDSPLAPVRLWHRLTDLLLFQLPLFLLFAAIVAGYAIERFRDEYILPQIPLHKWDAKMETGRHTYYSRLCNVSDISATHRDEILLKDAMDEEDALQLFQKHGTVLLADIISPETASELREFILSENEENADTVNIFEAENRWSFSLDIDQHPIIAKACKEVLSNNKLVRVIEAVVGPNPAVTELTAITSAPGAAQQHFHTDSGIGANRFSRNFFPAISLFTALQNTTRAMGTTDICPGTHHCYEGAETKYACEAMWAHQSILTDDDDNWPVGWAALTSQQTFHRGSAHTDSESPHRVMFYFTFAPRPRFGPFQLETRSFALGGTNGQKWHQWGHTLRDYQDPDNYMKLPWRLLRTWGLYLPPGRQWGWDYWSLAAAGLCNMAVYSFLTDLFDWMIDIEGGYPYVPEFLQAHYGYEDAEAYIKAVEKEDEELFLFHFDESLKRTRKLALLGYAGMLTIYAGRALLLAYVSPGPRNTSFARLLTLQLLLVAAALALFHRLEKTSWSKSIKSGRVYQFPQKTDTFAANLPATLPTPKDLLVLDHMRSDYLGYLSGVFDVYHPGNAAVGELMLSRSHGFDRLSSGLQRQLCRDILRWARQQGHRVLHKNIDFEWGVATSAMQDRFCHKEMMKRSSRSIGFAIEQLDNLLAETRFGFWRETVLHRSHLPHLLYRLQDGVMRYRPRDVNEPGTSNKLGRAKVQAESLPSAVRSAIGRRSRLRSTARVTARPYYFRHVRELSQEPAEGPPYPQAWLQAGNIVEVSESSYQEYWYRATIVNVDSNKLTYHVLYDRLDKEGNILVETGVQRYSVRPWTPYTEGEPVDYFEDNTWVAADILQVHSQPGYEAYDIAIVNSLGGHERSLHGVSASQLRRLVHMPSLFLGEGMQVIARHPSSNMEDQWWRAIVRETISFDSVLVEYMEFFDSEVEEVHVRDVRLFEWAS